MAITLVNSTGTSGSAANGGTVTLTFTGLVSSDYIVVSATRGTSRVGAQTVTSSSGGSYTPLLSTLTSSGCQFSVWGQLVDSAGTPTQAIVAGTAGTSDSCVAIGAIWRGVQSSSPTDATTTSTTGNSSQPNSPSLTVVNSSDIVITTFGQQSNITGLTQPSGYTLIGNINRSDNWNASVGQAYIVYNSTSAVDPGPWASNVVGVWCSATVALRSIAPSTVPWQDYGFFPDIPDLRTYSIVGY